MALMQISHPTTRYTLFSALTFGAHQETIKVRVTRIWDAMSYRMSDDVAAHFILLDEKVTCTTDSPFKYLYILLYYIRKIVILTGQPNSGHS